MLPYNLFNSKNNYKKYILIKRTWNLDDIFPTIMKRALNICIDF